MNQTLDSLLLVLFAVLAAACIALSALPARYVATAQVLVPAQADGKSRLRALREEAADRGAAAQMLEARLAAISGLKAVVIDELAVREKPAHRWVAVPGLLFLLIFLKRLAARRARRARAPERALVREAVMLAQRGHKAALVDYGSGFRVVLADSAPDRAELRVLARLSGGALVLARRS